MEKLFNDCLLFIEEERRKRKEFEHAMNKLKEWADTQPFISNKCNNIIKNMDNSYEHNNVCIYKHFSLNDSNEKIIANAWEILIENENLLIKTDCRIVLNILKNINDKENINDNNNQSGDNQSGQGGGIIAGAISKGLNYFRRKE